MNPKQKQARVKKFRFLFDTAFARPSVFTKLHKKANLKHVRFDFNFARQAEDKDIYTLATREKRIVITHDRDFLDLAKKGNAGVFIVSSYQTNARLDTLIASFIVGKNPDDFVGKAVKIAEKKS